MSKTRPEAFSDAVIAIVLTIMVLELRPPHEAADLAALRPMLPVFLSYLLSFVFLGIYWNNHHHWSLAIYAAAIAMAFSNTTLSCLLYVVVAILWLVPDPRIERLLAERGDGEL
jgi:uncharacterized membrane protein